MTRLYIDKGAYMQPDKKAEAAKQHRVLEWKQFLGFPDR